jgi:hypothetical protein
MIYIQVTTTVPGASDYVSDSFPLHVQTPSGTGGLPAPELSYVYIPRSIRLRHLDGKDASSLVIEATKNATLYVDVDDFGRDGNPLNDYVIFPVSPQNIQITGRLNTDDEAIVVGSSSYSPLIGQTPDSPPPTRLGTVTLHARNAGGTESSGYDPLYTEVRYELAFAGTTASGANISNIMPGDNGETTLQTPWVSVTVTPHDDGDGGSGGTCGVLGMGATALMILPLAFLRKKRGKSA